MASADKILVVDDDLEAVDPLMKAFEMEGFEVHYAADGAIALEMVHKVPVNLILLDIMMPNLSGYETLKRLQADDLTAYIPVIFITGHFNEEDIVKGLQAGAVDAISKPFRISEVMTRGRIRMAEAKLKRRYTPVVHFFAEAQEKEISRRSGVFEFYDRSKSRIGDIFIEDGKVVYATSKDAIKEDAFLQLASTREATYMFQEGITAPNKTLAANITSLILEASKIVDELDSKEIRSEAEKRVLIIDQNRIPRILASRTLKATGLATMVTSSEEITQEKIDKYDPDVVIIDHADAEILLGKLQLVRGEKARPVIIYSDADNLEELSTRHQVGTHDVYAIVSKTRIDHSLSHAVQQALLSSQLQA